MADDLVPVSGLDDVFYDYTITDESTGAAMTTGAVSIVLTTHGTTTSLGTGATQTLTHVAAGRWTAVHDTADIVTALGDLPIGAKFDRLLVITGGTTRRVAICKRVAVVDN
jgi:hypothetical protein